MHQKKVCVDFLCLQIIFSLLIAFWHFYLFISIHKYEVKHAFIKKTKLKIKWTFGGKRTSEYRHSRAAVADKTPGSAAVVI